jgi:glutaminase
VSTPTKRQVDERLDDLYRRHLDLGEAAEFVTHYYSPEHGNVSVEQAGEADDSDRFSICLVGTEGDVHTAGDVDRPFALQSLSKIFTYGLALEEYGREAVLERVGVKPSADSFASLAYDEETNRPFNPMVNAGAIVIADMILTCGLDDPIERILELLRKCAGNPKLVVDEEVYEGEQKGGDRNRAIAYLMHSEGMLEGDVEEALALYLRQCSVEVSCRDLAVMAATLASGCVNPITGERALPRDCVRDLLSVMYTCGMYDFAGEWAYEVGVPAKSGVSGGILAAIPGTVGIGVFSPGLDRFGNSVRGVRVCREISERRGLHVFAADEEESLMGTTG